MHIYTCVHIGTNEGLVRLIKNNMLEKIEDFEYKVLVYVCVDAFMNVCIHIHAYIFSYIYAHAYVFIIVPCSTYIYIYDTHIYTQGETISASVLGYRI